MEVNRKLSQCEASRSFFWTLQEVSDTETLTIQTDGLVKPSVTRAFLRCRQYFNGSQFTVEGSRFNDLSDYSFEEDYV